MNKNPNVFRSRIATRRDGLYRFTADVLRKDSKTNEWDGMQFVCQDVLTKLFPIVKTSKGPNVSKSLSPSNPSKEPKNSS